jgi:hypothetical protein
MFDKLVTVFVSSCTPNKFVMLHAPGHPPSLRFSGQSAHLHAIKILYRDNLLPSIHLCTAIAPEGNKICTMTAKTRAIPSLHRDNFAAKEPGGAQCLRRVTQPPFIAGPLGANLSLTAQLKIIEKPLVY